MNPKFKELEQSCKKSIEHFRHEMGRMRTGRANTALLESLPVEYYGTMTPLQQLGLINAPEPRLLTVQVYDTSAVESVDKAIRGSNLGLNPSREGNVLRVPVPTLTEERRKDLVKTLHKMAEEAKVAIRNHRRDVIEVEKKAKKDGKISEDELRRETDEVQKITDKFTSEVDQALTAKEKEMMEV
jgi:ribosome recycling factor